MRFPDLRFCCGAAENEGTHPTQPLNDDPAAREVRFLLPAGIMILGGRPHRKQLAYFCEIDEAPERFGFLHARNVFQQLRLKPCSCAFRLVNERENIRARHALLFVHLSTDVLACVSRKCSMMRMQASSALSFKPSTRSDGALGAS